MGHYSLQPSLREHGRPVYRRGGMYLFYFQYSSTSSSGYWELGPTLGTDVDEIAYVSSNAGRPELITESWSILPSLETQCRVCNVVLHGTSVAAMEPYMGVYSLQPSLRESYRPVYRRGSIYLFHFRSNYWELGPTLGTDVDEIAYVSSEAGRPELITDVWRVKAPGFMDDAGLGISCNVTRGPPTPAPTMPPSPSPTPVPTTGYCAPGSFCTWEGSAFMVKRCS